MNNYSGLNDGDVFGHMIPPHMGFQLPQQLSEETERKIAEAWNEDLASFEELMDKLRRPQIDGVMAEQDVIRNTEQWLKSLPKDDVDLLNDIMERQASWMAHPTSEEDILKEHDLICKLISDFMGRFRKLKEQQISP